jgi:fermentation-respiration switch protein FrsA (DUF1100 family)
MKRNLIDERTERINGTVSFYILILTQLALVGVMVYKRYFLGLPETAYSEISWIALVSMAGYWAVRLFLSGILPVLSFRKMILIYFGLVAMISIPTYLIHGWPEKEHWFEVLYPLIGAAIVLGIYSLVAYLGKRRVDRLNE